jgi:hypothetical protein
MKTFTLPDFNCVTKIDDKYFFREDNFIFRLEFDFPKNLLETDDAMDTFIQRYFEQLNNIINNKSYSVERSMEQADIPFKHKNYEYHIVMVLEVITVLVNECAFILRPTINKIAFRLCGGYQIFIIHIDFKNILSYLSIFQSITQN